MYVGNMHAQNVSVTFDEKFQIQSENIDSYILCFRIFLYVMCYFVYDR
jgi:hypothetical protein